MIRKISFLGGFIFGFLLLSNISYAERNTINNNIENKNPSIGNPFVPVKRENIRSLNTINLNLNEKVKNNNIEEYSIKEKEEVIKISKKEDFIKDNYIVRRGNFLKMFLNQSKIDQETIREVVYRTKDIEKITNLRINQKLFIEKDKNNNLNRIVLELDDLKTVQLVKNDKGSGFIIKDVDKEYTIVQSFAEGTVNSSLYNSASQSGLSREQVNQIISIFDWNIDFKRDVKRGDSFKVLFEEKYIDDKKIGNGDILTVSFNISNKQYNAFLYIDENGNKNYYDENGNGLGKSFIRHPIQNARISSHFNPRRMHPVHNRVMPHRGVDYAAPTGTPIRATGDGVISFIGVNGGYGNTIIIDHGNGYTTLYAHMVRFQNGLRKGSKISQKDIIGFVGMTGTATGPHLHYEFRINGVHKDPIRVALPDNSPIPIRYASDFEKSKNNYLAILNNYKEINNNIYTAQIKNNNRVNIN